MENNMKNFDDLFREEFADYAETPPPAVWQGLEKRLDEDKKRRAFPLRWYWYFSLISFITLLGAALLWNYSSHEASLAVAAVVPAEVGTITAESPALPVGPADDPLSGAEPRHPATKANRDLQNTPKHTDRNNNLKTTPHTAKHSIAKAKQKRSTVPAPINASDDSYTSTEEPTTDLAGANAPATGTSMHSYDDFENEIAADNSVKPAATVAGNGFVAHKSSKNKMVVVQDIPLATASVAPATPVTPAGDEPLQTDTRTDSHPVAAVPAAGSPAAESKERSTTTLHKQKQSKPHVPVHTRSVAVNTNRSTQTSGTPAAVVPPKQIQTEKQPATDRSTPHTATPARKTTSQLAAKEAVKSTAPIASQKNAGQKHTPSVPATTTSSNTATRPNPSRESTTIVGGQPHGQHSNTATHNTVAATSANTARTVAAKQGKTQAPHRAVASSVATGTVKKPAPVVPAKRPKEVGNSVAVTPPPARSAKGVPQHRQKVNTPVLASVPPSSAAEVFPPGQQTSVADVSHVSGTSQNGDVDVPQNKSDKSTAEKNVVTPVAAAPAVSGARNKLTVAKSKRNTTANTKNTASNVAAVKTTEKPAASGSYAAVPSNSPAKSRPAVTATSQSVANSPQPEPPVAAAPAAPQLSASPAPAKPVLPPPAPAPVVAPATDSVAAAIPDSPTTDSATATGRFSYGLKVGYETATQTKTANKGVFAPFVEYRLSKKLSLMIQPAIKASAISRRNFGTTNSFYEVNAGSGAYEFKDSALTVLVFTGDSLWRRNYEYTETHDSIVKTYSTGGTYVEVEMPLLLKYSLSAKLSVYGGINTAYGRLAGVREHTAITRRIPVTGYVSTLADINAPAPAVTETGIVYTGNPISGYTGPAYPAPSGSIFRMGYMLGFSYEIRRRWLADVLLQQCFTKKNIQGGVDINAPLSVPYVRLSVGYRLSK